MDSSVIQQQKRLSVSELANQIRSAHQEFQDLVPQIVNLGIQVENARIKIGCLLLAVRDSVPHGAWNLWVKTNVSFSYETARRFMGSAAAAKLSPLTDLEQLQEYHKLLVLWGLRESGGGHGPQLLHSDNPFAQFERSLAKAREHVDKLVTARPVQSWSADSREQAKEMLEPLVKIYQQL